MRFLPLLLSLLLLGVAIQGEEPLSALVRTLAKSDDPQFQLDVLKGIADGLKGRRELKMPAGWEELAAHLTKSSNPAVRDLARSLSVTFGSKAALQELRDTLLDASAPESTRRAGLQSLLAARDPGLIPVLPTLLKDPAVRAPLVRGLAAYDDPAIPGALVETYSRLSTLEKKDAVTTLVARVAFAKQLLAAIADKKIPARDLTPDILRLLRNLNDAALNQQLQEQFGVARETGEDKAREIARYRGMVESSPPGDARRGREVFMRACQQCHLLFGEGGKAGPDLTGSDRGNLYYILQNIIDPNAIIPNDYRTSILETKDDRVITGVVTKQDGAAVTIVTANETLVIPKSDIQSLTQGQISLMPEGLIQSFTDTEVRDLVAFLKSSK